jgi:hypothetical protein
LTCADPGVIVANIEMARRRRNLGPALVSRPVWPVPGGRKCLN